MSPLMDCVTGFASSISSELVKAITRELCYPCCFNNFIQELKQAEGKLITTRESVEDRVQYDKKQARKTDKAIDHWLERAKTDEDTTKKLLEKAIKYKSCCPRLCPNLICRYLVGKKLAQKKVNLENCIKECPKDMQPGLPTPLPLVKLGFLKFDSRKVACEKLMEALTDDGVAKIGLYGMGGCGKTSLAMIVKEKAETEHLFKVIFVPVSSKVDVRSIQEKIASSLQFQFLENGETERALRLRERLIQETKVLVILDDVWKRLEFGDIGIPSNNDHKGCKVLITTRSEDICKGMDCQRKVKLSILTNEEAWALFREKTNISEKTSISLQELARKISDKCKGLPVAIAAVASSLKAKEMAAWRAALNRLKSKKQVNIEEGLQNPYKCLQLSYDNLDAEETKSLFLLCSAFPEDYEISVEYLTRYAIGLGFGGEDESYVEARYEVIAATDKLISSCLLLKADEGGGRVKMHEEGGRVKMHDLVRDVGQWIAKKSPPRYLCLWHEEFPNELNCSNLQFLCLETKLEVLDEMLKGMGNLRVLHLVNKEERKPLSTMSFKFLTNLHCLFLKRWQLSDISFIGDLKKLQSLTLMSCSFLELSNDVLARQLINLRLVDVRWCDMERVNYEVILRLPQLEELYIFAPDLKLNACDEKTEFPNSSVSQTLQRYFITSNALYSSGMYSSGIDYITDDRILILGCFHPSNAAFMGLAKKAEVLEIGNIEGDEKNIIPNLIPMEGGSMHELKVFEVSWSKEIEWLVDNSKHLNEVRNPFSNLIELSVHDMEQLRALWIGQLPPNGPFEKLEKLKIEDCPKLTCLLTASEVELEELEISRYDQRGGLVELKNEERRDCNEEEKIIEDEEGQHSPPTTTWVNYKSGFFTLSSLTRLSVKSCPKLGSLFTASTAKTLTSLEELYIVICHGLKHLVSCERAHSNQKENTAEDDHNFQSDISMFLSLKKLRINGCDLLQSIFPVSIVGGPVKLNDTKNKETSDLKYLFVKNNFEDDSCHQQQKNIQIELPVLEELELDCIPNLISSIPCSYQVTCPSLQKLSLGIGRYIGFFTINCSTTTSEARHLDYIIIKISNSDSLQLNESGQYLPKQSQGLNLLIMRNIREIQLNGFDTVKYLFNLSTASSMMLEILTIKECGGLEHIIDTGDAYDRNNWDVVFPNLKKLSVYHCDELEYIFGQYPMDNQDYKETHIHFPALETLYLHDVPNFVSICANNSLSMLCPSLKKFQLDGNSQLINNCIRDLMLSLDSRVPVSTSSKDSGDIQKHFFPLETLCIRYSTVESIFHLNKHQMNGQQVSFGLENLELKNLPQMTYIICMASKNSFTFQNLKRLEIVGCAKLEVIFPVSVLRCLPELKKVEIKKCKELKQIIEEDVEDKKLSNLRSPQPCFPKLEALAVQQCRKLKRLISTSASNDLPNLKVLIINGAIELEELIGCEQGKGDEIGNPKVELPNLKLVVFMHLSTLQQGTELLTVKHRIVHNCPKLSLSSTATLQELRDNFPFEDFGNSELPWWVFQDMLPRIIESDEVSISGGTKVENATEEGTTDLPIDIKSQSASTSDLTPSQFNEEPKKEFIGKVPGSEVLVTMTSTDSELNERPSPSPLDICLHKTHLHEWDPTPENASQLQMTHEDPTKFEKVNDTNQSILGNMDRMEHEQNQIENGATVSESYEFLESERDSERTQDLQSLEQKMLPISSLNSTETIDKTEANATENIPASGKPPIPTSGLEQRRPCPTSLATPLRKIPSHKLVDQESGSEQGFRDEQLMSGEPMSTEDIRKENIQEGPAIEGATIKTLSAGVQGFSLGGGVATHTESSGRDILAHDSQVGELDEKLNVGMKEIMPCQKILDVDDSIREGSNMMDRKEGIDDVSNDSTVVSPASTDTLRRLGAYKLFVELDDAQIALLEEAIAVYPHIWNVCGNFSERLQVLKLKTLADMLLFLRSESPTSVTQQREKEFHRLCNDAVQLGFERSWVDEMRQRVVVRDPEMDHAQARINELLKRHDHLTWELCKIKNELKSVNDLVDTHTKCFDFL